MYDTLEIPLTPDARFSDRVSVLKSEVELASKCHRMDPEIPYTENFYYSQVVDLRKVADIDAVLHLNAKHGKTGTHKIQLLEAGRKCAGQIADTISRVVNDHPDLLAVSRVDSCADLVDGPEVCWMAQTVRARSAQWQAEFGQAELRDGDGRKVSWSEMGKREVQTMYIGKRPNCFRVYDKLAERRAAWSRDKRRHEKMAAGIVLDKSLEAAPDDNEAKLAVFWVGRQDQFRPREKREARDFYIKRLGLRCSGRYYIPFPDFETWFATQCVGPLSHLVQMRLPGQEEPEQLDLIRQLPKVVTRVERQMAAGRVPESLDTFEKLFSSSALDFNPFERLEFSSFNATTEIDMGDFSPVQFAAGMQFKHWLETGMTYQQLYAYWNTRRNAKAIAKKFAPFVSAANPPKVVSITSSDLYERYRSSVSRQMAA
jgi:hypothetical protein